ncbi:sugar phosphate isomerase/epimerase [Actinobacteria bacterium YIM 96077]|uniref:Sugar phosphate isomerase/epimerase n=1 Tax=Phytoactinopolyspora halophila TaxID=1981511 RepID=A0A329QL51_9ACTN|nr:sugar phosphate isomerase/epimerase [Phytoactinopolyspora halophila]AYY14790.1 sugar phosphate isomerase/epimerase [Actinobacteria bacterium YIM 96077]RAW13064.1 sugar phosphate isomerase/epimerase [Phytoactinopolyspora halophila]
MAHTKIDRRRFLSALAGTTAAAGTAAFAGATTAGATTAARPSGSLRRRLIPPGRIGIQLWSVRDAIAELGFRVVLEELARMGFVHIEFAGYSSPAEPDITPAQIRQLLDDNGLNGIGGHRGIADFRNNMEAELDIAETMGFPYIGTANEPVSPGNRTVDGYKAAADEFNSFGEAARARGLKWYHHNHHNEFRFAADNPEVRLYDLLLSETDPHLVYLELDIYWAYVGQHIAPGFDPVDYVKAHSHRYPLFHTKDGARRPDLPHGYEMTEFGEGDIDYESFYRALPRRGSYVSLWEQDNAPATPADGGGSLGAAERSCAAMKGLRG